MFKKFIHLIIYKLISHSLLVIRNWSFVNHPIISIIAAIASDRAIGYQNRLLWHIKKDLAHFHKITLGHPVIMGERTYRSIGRLLPGRTNIILTYDKNYKVPGAIIAHSLDSAIKSASQKDRQEIFVIGGGMVYAAALPLVDKLYLTIVEGKYKADTFFPEYEHLFTKVIKQESGQEGKYKFRFLELVRRK